MSSPKTRPPRDLPGTDRAASTAASAALPGTAGADRAAGTAPAGRSAPAAPAVPSPRGNSAPLGATVVPGGVNFSVFSRTAGAIDLLLFDGVNDAKPSNVIR